MSEMTLFAGNTSLVNFPSRVPFHCLGFKRPFPLAPPERNDLLALLSVRLLHEPEQRPVDRSAVVLDQHIEPGLDDEPAEFDEPTRPLAALHDPVPRISPRPLRLQPVAESL